MILANVFVLCCDAGKLETKKTGLRISGLVSYEQWVMTVKFKRVYVKYYFLYL